tara:strand:- start:169 stop:498 length:330 start_codon:yes stop_codon:yes gene_type:complete
MSNFAAHLVCPTTIDLDCEYRETALEIVEEEKEAQLLIYPNPASEQFHLINPFFGNTKVEIVNIQGRSVRTLDLSDKKKLVRIYDLAKGYYIVRFKQGELIRNEHLFIE